MFDSWADLGSEVHAAKSEVEAAYKVCRSLIDRFGCKIACIAVDNAAKGVADATAKLLQREMNMMVLVLRYALHLLLSLVLTIH